MKRFNTALALACAFILSMGSAFADPTFGYPNSYTLATDLNQNNAQTTANVALNPSSPPQCNIQVYGTFSANLQIYTSVLGTFGDEVSVGSAITAPTYGTAIAVNMAGNRAIRVIDTAYTSGDPVVAVDCSQGQLVTAPVAPVAGGTFVVPFLSKSGATIGSTFHASAFSCAFSAAVSCNLGSGYWTGAAVFATAPTGCNVASATAADVVFSVGSTGAATAIIYASASNSQTVTGYCFGL